MLASMDVLCQKKNDKGNWEIMSLDVGTFHSRYYPSPFKWTSLNMYKFLSISLPYPMNIPCITGASRGLPDEMSYDDRLLREHDFYGEYGGNWILTEELLSFDYSKEYFTQYNPKKQVVRNTLRNLLGPEFFCDLSILKEIGVERIVVAFRQ